MRFSISIFTAVKCQIIFFFWKQLHTGVNRKGGEKNKREENNKYEGGGESKMESGELRGKREFLSLPRTWQCSCSQSVPSAPGACQPASEENGTRPRQKHAVTPPPP